MRASERGVLFLDEFDTIAKERGDVHETGEIKRVVSTLLLQMDSCLHTSSSLRRPTTPSCSTAPYGVDSKFV